MRKRIEAGICAWLLGAGIAGCKPGAAGISNLGPPFERSVGEDCAVVNRAVVLKRKTGAEFPVYGGKTGVMYFDELVGRMQAGRTEPGIEVGLSFCTIVPRGKVRETVEQLLKFYSGNVLRGKDWERPTEIDYTCRLADPPGWCIVDARRLGSVRFYDVPDFGIFGVSFPTVPGKKIVRSVHDIPFAETGGWHPGNRSKKDAADALIQWGI
jgi:hypothetical protein